MTEDLEKVGNYQQIKTAFLNAILCVGFTNFKSTSMFGSNEYKEK